MGKTTIAELVFAEVSSQFDLCCFFRDVRQKLENLDKVQVKKLFYSQLLRLNTFDIQALQVLATETLEELSRKRAVVVLDDVSKLDQLEGLGVSEGWFGQGSRIIITSRDKQVLNSCVDQIHQMEGLNDGDAVELLKMKAFQKMDPEEGHMLLIGRVVNYCKGLPLAIKVLGSHLCQRTPKQWEIELRTLGKHPNPDIMDILKISYDSLTPKQKDMFLDVACFFEGYNKDQVTPIFDACGFPSEQGLMRLVDKCLITINEYNRLKMHDLIEEMGRHVAQEQGSRLWDSKKICRLLRSNKGNEAVQIIDFNMNGIEKVQLHQKALSGMPKLRILRLHGGKEQNIELIQQSDQPNLVPLLPDNLSLFHWTNYPFESLPSRLFAENLVELRIQGSNITQLWDGDQCLEKLKMLDLSNCQQLIRLPNLSSATSLTSVNLSNCKSLDEINSWIKCLYKLTVLKLTGCKKLRSLPSMVELESLKTLLLSGCSSLKMLPDMPIDIRIVKLDESGVEEWPSSICRLRNLLFVSVKNCRNITKIPSKFLLNFNAVGYYNYYDHYNFNCVGLLSLSGCQNLHNLPMIKGDVSEIDFSWSGIQELPPLDGLSSLTELCLKGCSKLVTLHSLHGLKSLEKLDLNGCSKLVRLPPLDDLRSLKRLDLDGCSKLAGLPSLDTLRSLEKLGLSGCSELVKLPSLHGLSRLKILNLDETALMEIPNDIASLSLLKFLSLRNCKQLQCLPELPKQLSELDVTCCTCLTTVPSALYIPGIDFCAFRYLNCVNLDQEQRSKIMLDAQRFVKKLAIASKIGMNYKSYMLAIPGSEIPEWVMYQSEESSIVIDFPLDCFNTDNFLGFAFYVVLDLQPGILGWLEIFIRFNINSVPYPLCSYRYPHLVLQSDHVFLLYKGKSIYNNLGTTFELIPWAWGGWEKIKIKKFGVSPIYEGREEQAYFYNNRSAQLPSCNDGATIHDFLKQWQQEEQADNNKALFSPCSSGEDEWGSFLSLAITPNLPQ